MIFWSILPKLFGWKPERTMKPLVDRRVHGRAQPDRLGTLANLLPRQSSSRNHHVPSSPERRVPAQNSPDPIFQTATSDPSIDLLEKTPGADPPPRRSSPPRSDTHCVPLFPGAGVVAQGNAARTSPCNGIATARSEADMSPRWKSASQAGSAIEGPPLGAAGRRSRGHLPPRPWHGRKPRDRRKPRARRRPQGGRKPLERLRANSARDPQCAAPATARRRLRVAASTFQPHSRPDPAWLLPRTNSGLRSATFYSGFDHQQCGFDQVGLGPS